MADLVIYGSPVSPFVRKAAAVCIEKGVDFELESVNVFDPPDWFREISPMKRIPVLRDRSIAEEGIPGTIADSSAICGYIEKKHPDVPMYPAEPYAYGRALWIEEYADSHLAATGGLGIFRAVFFNMMQGKEPDVETTRETWAEKMPPILTYLDSALGDGEFYAGETLSIAGGLRFVWPRSWQSERPRPELPLFTKTTVGRFSNLKCPTSGPCAQAVCAIWRGQTPMTSAMSRAFLA